MPRSAGRLILLCLGLFATTTPGDADSTRTALVTAAPRSQVGLDSLVKLGLEPHPVEVDDPRATPFGIYQLEVPAEAVGDLDRLGIDYSIEQVDLEAYYRSRLTGPSRAFHAAPGGSNLGVGSMGGYFTFDEVVTEMDALQSAYPGLMLAKASIGSSVENRPLWVWKLSANPAVDEDEPEVLTFSLMHAREPAGMMSVVYLAERLLADYGTDPESTYLLDHREVWLIPVLNPDGYVYNQSVAPNGGAGWRKNRANNFDGTVGVDINRNFGFLWGFDDTGSSPIPANSNYRGPTPFSEPETQALVDFAIAHRPRVAINTHTYKDFVIRPWGYDNIYTPDDATFLDITRQMTRGNAYLPGNCMATWGYLTNGDCDAWMYGEVVTKPRIFGFTPELGNTADGFWPATTRILPIAEEGLRTHLAAIWAAGPTPGVASITFDDVASGDGDGWLEHGEGVVIAIDLYNHGLDPTWGPITAQLSSPACSVLVEDAGALYPMIAPQALADGSTDTFAVHIDNGAEPGTVVTLTLTLSDNRGPYPPIDVRLLVGEPTVLFDDDLENGTGSWSLTGWALESVGGSNGQALSDSPGANYPVSSDLRARITTVFDLSNATRAWLTFDQRLWIDNDFDAGRLEVSTDGANTWTSIAGDNSGPPSGVGRQDDSQPIYDGHIFDWQPERVDLSATAGRPDVRIRFSLLTNGANGYDGWLFDNVRLLAFNGAPGPCPACGDATVDPGESCDDGNDLPGDGCNAVCQFEGACCLPPLCQNLSSSDCANLGGTHVANGTACNDLPSPCLNCDISAIGRVVNLLAAKVPPAQVNVEFHWDLTQNAGDGYEVWAIALDKTLIPACGPSCNPQDAAICALTGPGITTCVHPNGVAGGGGDIDYYNVVGVCGGQQGAP